MAEDEEMLYSFCTELHQNKSVSDATYARAVAAFGEQGVIDIDRHLGLLHDARDGAEHRAHAAAGRPAARARAFPTMSAPALPHSGAFDDRQA